MLKRLGIRMFAYDGRPADMAHFDQEVAALRQNGITLQAFWLRVGLNPETEEQVGSVLSLLKRYEVKTQLWCSLSTSRDFQSSSEEERFTRAVRAVRYVAEESGKIGCSVGLYGSGGWAGEPENQLELLKRISMKNVGIVYNFEHGYSYMDRFTSFFPRLVPYLMAVNLSGMRTGDPQLLPVGAGDRDAAMLKGIRDSGYHGPIGIINTDRKADAEVGLKANIDGLRRILREIGDDEALKTY
jgi:sugar phosphate isomerase/epimerase